MVKFKHTHKHSKCQNKHAIRIIDRGGESCQATFSIYVLYPVIILKYITSPKCIA